MTRTRLAVRRSARLVAAACLALCGCSAERQVPEERVGSAASALDALVLGPEEGTDRAVWGRAEQPQHSVSLARSDAGVLFVWHDTRRNEGGDVFAARTTLDGALLDPAGLAVSTFA